MNWVFLDCISWDYDVVTPLTRPLGGSQSALAYLALALARRGQTVTTLTATSKPRTVDGVRCLNYDDVPANVFDSPQTITVVNAGPASFAETVRRAIGPDRLLVLWTGHAHDQPAVQALRDKACLAQWDRIACVSEWQKSQYQQQLGVPAEKIDVLRNGISPAFVDLFQSAEALAKAKSAAGLRLTYTSTPFRGLDLLIACFPAIHRRHPASRLDVFSSMQVYNQPDDQDPYQTLYAQCRATEGIDYRGSVSQSELAKELVGVTMLAYPNTFAETSCIAVMEALAAGLLVVSSDLGGLPETCSGWARLIPPAGPNRTKEQFAIDFARAADQALHDLRADQTKFFNERFEQSRAISDSCNWDARAADWEQAAQNWLTKK